MNKSKLNSINPFLTFNKNLKTTMEVQFNPLSHIETTENCYYL